MHATITEHITLVDREQLEKMIPACACGHPRFIRPGCHPQAQMRAAYSDGMLALFCDACEAPVFAVRVGGRRSTN